MERERERAIYIYIYIYISGLNPKPQRELKADSFNYCRLGVSVTGR